MSIRGGVSVRGGAPCPVAADGADGFVLIRTDSEMPFQQNKAREKRTVESMAFAIASWCGASSATCQLCDRGKSCNLSGFHYLEDKMKHIIASHPEL